MKTCYCCVYNNIYMLFFLNFVGTEVDWIAWFFCSWIIKTRPLTNTWIFLDTAADTCQRQFSDDKQCFQDKIGGIFNDIESGKETAMEMGNSCLHIACDTHGEGIHPVLREVAEWEIQWEDLRIGERIGIGKFFFILIYSVS